MIFRERAMVDETWQMIAEATVTGKLGCTSKVINIYTYIVINNSQIYVHSDIYMHV